MRGVIKGVLHPLALLLTAPAGLLCRLESASGSKRIYLTFVQVFAWAPGFIGMSIRRAFYCWTLAACDPECHIGFGTLLNHREARIGRHAYIGDYSIVGKVTIGDRSLIGSKASLMSGSGQHQRLPEGRWTVDQGGFTPITVGEDVWIGEGALVMADIGRGAMVSAGAVVSSPIKNDILVAGNPARFVCELDVSEMHRDSK